MAETDRGTDEETRATYNGWVNYPTWAAYTWLSNEEGSDRVARELVADASGVYLGADELRAWVEVNNPLADDASLYADILGWAIQSVSWVDVARAFAPEAQPDATEDDLPVLGSS